jgi:lysine-N-methylase
MILQAKSEGARVERSKDGSEFVERDQASPARRSTARASMSPEVGESRPHRRGFAGVEAMRPRLAPDVAVRRHLVDGRPALAVHDTRDGRLAVVGEREGALLRCADGTRDLEGIRLAAERLGARATPSDVERWFSELRQAGLIVDADEWGAPTEDVRAEAPLRVADEVRPLRPLPGYRLRCDGRGSCCRFYPTTLFTEADAVRARALAPDVLGAGDDASRAFTPSRGASGLSADGAGRDFAGLAVTMVDGACAYLDRAGCRIHAAGGASAKPTGCRLYPASFVDDGECVRVSVLPECACVFRSGLDGATDGEPLILASNTAELDPLAHVERLPETLVVSDAATWSRTRYLDWHRAASTAIEADPAVDAAAFLHALAEGLDDSGAAPRHGDDHDLREALAPELQELIVRARRRSALHAPWRSVIDLARLVPSWLAATGDVLARKGVGSPSWADERLYLRSVAYGHVWIADGVPLRSALRRRAARVLLARWLDHAARAEGFANHEPALEHPLALVEAAARWL